MVTLGQLVDDYFRKLTLSGRSERTIAHYRDYIENFGAFAAEHGVKSTTPATRLDRELLQRYQVHLAERPSARASPLRRATCLRSPCVAS